MLNPLIIGLIVFAVILGGDIRRLGDQRTPPSASPDRRDKEPRVGIHGGGCHDCGACAWTADLQRQHSFSALGGEVTTLSAQILRLDQMLRRYGPETDQAREMLRQYAEFKTADLFPDDSTDVRLSDPSTYELLQGLEDSLLGLKPANGRDQWWLGQAMTLAAKIGDTRWLLAQQVGQGTPKAFLALLVFWLTLLFASFGLFAPPNSTSAITLVLCALAVAGAVGMILELEKGFGGLIHVSPKPMRQAVAALEAQPKE
jgi:hypothetical protein